MPKEIIKNKKLKEETRLTRRKELVRSRRGSKLQNPKSEFVK